MKKKIQKTAEKHICSICGEEYFGYGNNAQPVNDGRCCDECNLNIVIPARDFLINRENERGKRANVTLYGETKKL